MPQCDDTTVSNDVSESEDDSCVAECALPVACGPIGHLEVSVSFFDSLSLGAPDSALLLSTQQQVAIGALKADPMGVHVAVEEALRWWAARKKAGEARLLCWRRGLPAHAQSVLGKLDPFILQEMLQTFAHDDATYVNDLVAGFPVTGAVGLGGLGEDIPGGQRSRGRPGDGAAPRLRDLQDKCYEINMRTVQAAQRRAKRADADLQVAKEIWTQTQKDISAGRAGEPVDLDQVDMREILLVDSFAHFEQHGGRGAAKV